MTKETFRNEYKVPSYLIESIELVFQLSDSKTVVTSKLLGVKNPEANKGLYNITRMKLNGKNLKLLDIALDGVSLPRSSYKLDKQSLVINDLPEQFTLEIETEINPAKNTSLQGLYKSAGKYCTQCEAEGFRHITFYPDRPDVMATFTTRIEADKQKYPYLLSNGNLIETGEMKGGRHFATWHDPYPKPCYLFALVAGDFDLLEDSFKTASCREIALNIYVDKGKLNQCQHAMESLKKAMKWDEDVYDLEYDLDNYMIVAVSDFNMGAMENKGLNIFNTCYVLANERTATDANFEGVENVIAHEYFHNWTGNRVTCRDWFQLSLKEGLTVFRDQQFSSDMNSAAVKRVEDARLIKTLQFAEDAGPMAHPVRPDSYIEMNNFYTLTVYDKGAEVIRMMHTILGDKAFHLGIKLYFERHDGQAVTCEDFIKSMEDANEADLGLFRNWYSQAGTPEVEVTSHWNAESGHYSLIFNQDCPATPGQAHKELFLIPIRLTMLSEQGEMLKMNLVSENNGEQPIIRLPESQNEMILMMGERQHTVTFSGFTSEPVPSLLRGFSAPVKLKFNYSDEQLYTLLAFDNDSYSSWNAGQTLMTKIIMDLTDDVVNKRSLKNPDILISSLSALLDNDKVDPNLLAMSLKIPELDYLIEQFQQVPFDELVTAFRFLNRYIAEQLKDKLLTVYKKSASMANNSTKEAKGWRSLQNACLVLLAESDDEKMIELAVKQFNDSSGMTNSIAALKVVAHSQSTAREELLDRFYHRWQDEDLVVDKWFAVQATNPLHNVIDNIYQLLDHADFQLSNPNKIRALIASFAKGNLINFHRNDGQGYLLIADTIVKLNKLNPQIAARLTSSFNQWRLFDKNRRAMMKEQLNRLLELDNISVDVYEIASKALS